jgi:hypothetical protein
MAFRVKRAVLISCFLLSMLDVTGMGAHGVVSMSHVCDQRGQSQTQQ